MNLETKEVICPTCSSKNTRKYGIKKGKLLTLQKYQYKSCKRTFTLQANQTKNKAYPINIILNTISFYNLGYSQTEIQKLLKASQKFLKKQSATG